MFESKLIIMNKQTQTGPAGITVTWSEGATIEAKLSISNMTEILLAQAQGVRASGYLVVDVDKSGKPKYPIEINTYLKFPKGGFYVRVADSGVIEAGEGAPFQERQYSVEAMETLPR